MERGISGQARPDASLEIIRAMLCNPLVNALRHSARDEPLHHSFGDPRAHPLQILDRRLVGHTFGEEPIGSASSWARVCTYVSSSGVPVHITKTRYNTHSIFIPT